MAYFPAVSLSIGERVCFNFGRRPFKVKNNFHCCAINEPDCLIKNYYITSHFILDAIKRYVVVYYEYPHLSEDEKLMVGSVLFEYLIPLMNDKYILEDFIIQFFFELSMINKSEFFTLIIKTMEIHFSNEQLLEWTASFMSLLCERINTIPISK